MDVFEFLFLELFVVLRKKVIVNSGLEEGRPLVFRLDEIESELRLISSRVDNSVRMDDKVKLEKELSGLRNSVSDFSARFSGRLEFSSSKLKKDIEDITKKLESEIRDLSKGAREDLNSRRGEIEDSLKRLNEEVARVSGNMSKEIKDLSKDVEGVSAKVGKEVGELEKRMMKNSNVELNKRVGRLEKDMDGAVRVEEKVRLERELSRVRENVNGIFVKLSDEVSERSRKLGFEIVDLSKKVGEDSKKMMEDFGKASVENKDEVDVSLRKARAELDDVARGISRDILYLSKRVDQEMLKLTEDLTKTSIENKGEMEVLIKKLEAGLVNVSMEASEGALEVSRKIDREMAGVQEGLGGVSKLEKDVGVLKGDVLDISVSLKEDRKDLVKAIDGDILELREELKISFGKLNDSLKDVRNKAGLELQDWAGKVNKEIGVLVKGIDREKNFDVNKRVKVLEKERDGFVRIGEHIKFEGEVLKMKNSFDDALLKTSADFNFSLKRVEQNFKETEGKLIREVRELHKKLEVNSKVELERKVSVLEKELTSVARSLDREDDEVDVMKRGFDDRLFLLESGLEKLNVRVDEESVKDVSISLEGSETAKDLNAKIKEVNARVSEAESRADLENEKIYDRLSESLDLMMFWEKKLARLNDDNLGRQKVAGGDFGKVVRKKRASQVGVIRERKKVLERLRESHAKGRRKRVVRERK